jgi:hypothetical protein
VKAHLNTIARRIVAFARAARAEWKSFLTWRNL